MLAHEKPLINHTRLEYVDKVVKPLIIAAVIYLGIFSWMIYDIYNR